MRRIDRRVEEYKRTGQADAVLGDSVLDEAAGLWAAVQPSGTGKVTPEVAERLAKACLVLAELHHCRAGELPDGPARNVALARAYALLRLGLPDEFPHPLHALLGWHPHPGDRAECAAMLTALRETTWAHFACHASTDIAAPSQSGLALHDGRLTVRAISQQRLATAELAYLSACSTAHRGWQHAEECLHLASAFQLAGFRHVIASLWPLADDVATVAATEFYRHLSPTASADQAALAIHHVTRALRSDHPDRPDLWASLIHSGP